MFIPQKLFDTKEYQDLSTTNKAILMAFYSIADGDEKSKTYKTTRYFASREVLAKRSGYTEKIISKNTQILITTPFITLLRKTPTVNMYSLINDEDLNILLNDGKLTIIEDSWNNREKNSNQAKYFKNSARSLEATAAESSEGIAAIPFEETTARSSEGTHISNDNYLINNTINNQKEEHITNIKNLNDINDILVENKLESLNNISEELFTADAGYNIKCSVDASELVNDIIDTKVTLTSISDEFDTSMEFTEQDTRVLEYHLDNICNIPQLLYVVLDNNNWIKLLKVNYTKYEHKINNYPKLLNKVITYIS